MVAGYVVLFKVPDPEVKADLIESTPQNVVVDGLGKLFIGGPGRMGCKRFILINEAGGHLLEPSAVAECCGPEAQANRIRRAVEISDVAGF